MSVSMMPGGVTTPTVFWKCSDLDEGKN